MAHIKPEWYFLPSYQLLKYFEGTYGAILGIIACSVPFGLLFIWPFIDGWFRRRNPASEASVWIGILAVFAIIALTVWEAVVAH